MVMADLLALLPLIVTTAAAIVVMLVAGFSLFGREVMALLTTGLFMFCFFVQAATLVSMPFFPYQQTFGSMLAVSPFSGVAGLIILACGGFSALASQTYFGHNKGYVPEFYAMLLFAACGMLLLTMAAELITLFIALEIMSLAVYVLVGADRERLLRAEAVLKYLMLGAFSGGFFCYGGDVCLRWSRYHLLCRDQPCPCRVRIVHFASGNGRIFIDPDLFSLQDRRRSLSRLGG
jgi:NADH-quinone oxidoreductase subunit N